METHYTDGFFEIGPKHGFIPIVETLEHLPEEFKVLDQVCTNLPIIKKDGRFGTMHYFGAIVDEMAKIPNYISVLKEKPFEMVLYQSLYRSYCFLVSSFCLEPTYKSYIETRNYDPAREVIPENIAVPFCYISEKLGVFPWLEYHYSYGLGNVHIINKREDRDYSLENISIRSLFCGDTDEINFIKVHLLINLCTPDMIDGIFNTINGIKSKDAQLVNGSLKKVYDTIVKMNDKRRVMWASSDMKRYAQYRIFLMGVTGNEKIFHQGILYSGVKEERIRYRGETGAQDDIIPTLDIFTSVTDFYPDTILTKYLQDLRQYRPKIMIKFFHDLEENSKGIAERAFEIGGVTALIYLAATVNQIYNFRNGHWQFVQKYIMRNTTYIVATGGTPLNLWLPNQIKACLNKMEELLTRIKGHSDQLHSLPKDVHDIYSTLSGDHDGKVKLLEEQMSILNAENFKIEQVIKLDDRQT